MFTNYYPLNILYFIVNKYCGEQQEGVIRLVGGSTVYEGRVEVCSGHEWGTICNRNWGQQEAVVVCRQLGYIVQGKLIQSFYGKQYPNPK